MSRKYIVLTMSLLILGRVLAAQGSGRPAVSGGIYDKPYIHKSGHGTAIGGYMDLEWEINPDENTFNQHRLIPFIFSEITPWLHFSTELEFEETGEEIKVEYATLDMKINQWLTYRGGLILSPLGKFNMVHDSPWNDLVSRPLVDQQLIPTTLSEPGMGFTGTLYPSSVSVLGYEIYLVNGFNGDMLMNPDEVRIREGRGEPEDNNRAKSLVSRIVYSPFLGLELGASLHTGNYADAGNRNLTIGAMDATYQKGATELLLEGAVARIDLPDGSARLQTGYYLQPNYHFGFGWIPGFPDSKFTAMLRAGAVDFNANATGDIRIRYSTGINWRPIEDTVFKTEYALESTAPAGSDRTGGFDPVFYFGFASYF